MVGVQLSELDNSRRWYQTDKEQGVDVRPLNQVKDLAFYIEMEKHSETWTDVKHNLTYLLSESGSLLLFFLQ